jgi:hypothetical protein
LDRVERCGEDRRQRYYINSRSFARAWEMDEK